MRKIAIILSVLVLILSNGYAQNLKEHYYTTQDTIVITAKIENISLKFSKEEFNDIINNQPELYDDWIANPDETYLLREYKGFGGEAGQDTYYILYAYFLKQKNGSEYSVMRENLINLYSNINSIFQKIQYGGTYFGHQYIRILGYAEYAIYQYTYVDELKPYDIGKQKDLYVQSLRQLVQDEINFHFDVTVTKEEKKQRINTYRCE